MAESLAELDQARLVSTPGRARAVFLSDDPPAARSRQMPTALAQTQGWSPRQQNVSVGVTVNGTRGDLVPGKVQAG